MSGDPEYSICFLYIDRPRADTTSATGDCVRQVLTHGILQLECVSKLWNKIAPMISNLLPQCRTACNCVSILLNINPFQPVLLLPQCRIVCSCGSSTPHASIFPSLLCQPPGGRNSHFSRFSHFSDYSRFRPPPYALTNSAACRMLKSKTVRPVCVMIGSQAHGYRPAGELPNSNP